MEVDANGGAAAAAKTDAITNGSAKQPQATATGEGGSGAGEPVAAVVETGEAGTGAGAKDAVSTAGQAGGEPSKTSEGQGAPEAGAPASSDPKQKQIKPGAGSLKVQVRDHSNSQGGVVLGNGPHTLIRSAPRLASFLEIQQGSRIPDAFTADLRCHLRVQSCTMYCGEMHAVTRIAFATRHSARVAHTRRKTHKRASYCN
jgi:hypothetical protein